MGKFEIFVAGILSFVVASLAAEYASRKVWPRAPGN